MARPRIPSAIQDLKGAFDHNPDRTRKDAEGAGEFNMEPPPDLPEECRTAWHQIVARIPLIAVSSTDEIAVESAARLLTEIRRGKAEMKVYSELRRWLSDLGFTPVARTRLETPEGAVQRHNRMSKGDDKPKEPQPAVGGRFAEFGRRPS